MLPRLFGEVPIPDAVYREVVVERYGQHGAREVADAAGGWLSVHRVEQLSDVAELIERTGIQRGEAEAILLAGELNQDIIFLDDQAAVTEARSRSLSVVRTPALYIAAKRARLIASVQAKLDDLRRAGFRLIEEHYTNGPPAARDDRILEIVRKGEQLQFAESLDFFLENYSKPPIRARKTHEANQRAALHFKPTFGAKPVGEITTEDIEHSDAAFRRKYRFRPVKVSFKVKVSFNRICLSPLGRRPQTPTLPMPSRSAGSTPSPPGASVVMISLRQATSVAVVV